ncbi:MAG: NAD(+)/NADH kinase [Chloroflexi bacterium]|nr:NAD(+)/NADH kinase [Chloroflexota bacterium]
MLIGILHHPGRIRTQEMAAEIGEWLEARQIQVWLASSRDMAFITEQVSHTDLLVVLGGDGSLLRAARLASPYDLPVFGINLGKVGFLTEAEPDEWPEKLARVLAGDYWTEERLMLHAALQRNGRIINAFAALNDIVVGRGRQARLVRFELWVDGDLVTHYTADALIVATPTGSTAYAMAAGGPLLPPQLQNFIVAPVAAHLSFDRALVLHEHAEIAIHVHMGHEAYLTPDGQDGISLQDGDIVRLQKAEHTSLFARLESPGYFYRRIMARLGHRSN